MKKNNKNKKFRDKLKYIPLNPIMPNKFNAKRRKELREWEKEILLPNEDYEEQDEGFHQF